MYSSFVTQPRSSTRSRCIAPASAIGPPNPNVPSRRKYATNALRLTSAGAIEVRHERFHVPADRGGRSVEIFADFRDVVPSFAGLIAIDADHSRCLGNVCIADAARLEFGNIKTVAL